MLIVQSFKDSLNFTMSVTLRFVNGKERLPNEGGLISKARTLDN